MAGRALPSCRLAPPPLLLLLAPLLLASDITAVPRSGASVTDARQTIVRSGLQGGWRPELPAAAAAPRAIKLPLVAAAAFGFSRLLPFFTAKGRLIPGLAKNSFCCGRENIIIEEPIIEEPVVAPNPAPVVPETRIAGGFETGFAQYPWMAYIETDDGFCGGALVNDRYVVTAADCLVDLDVGDLTVILGPQTALGVPIDVAFAFGVDEIIRHPGFNPTTFENDIALLKLDEVLSLPIQGNLIAPICLPHRSRYIDKQVTVAGFGDVDNAGLPSDVLRSVNLRTINNLRCRELRGNTITKSQICAGASDIATGGLGACANDQGGPMAIRTWYKQERFTLIGITTELFGCGAANTPGVYTRVYSFLDWMLANMKDATYC